MSETLLWGTHCWIDILLLPTNTGFIAIVIAVTADAAEAVTKAAAVSKHIFVISLEVALGLLV